MASSKFRFFQPAQKHWLVNAVTGVINTFSSRPAGNAIVQEGVDDSGASLRWSFLEIEQDRFRWRGENTRGTAVFLPDQLRASLDTERCDRSGVTRKYCAPLGLPDGEGKSDPASTFPGAVRSAGAEVAYQRFIRKGSYGTLHALPADEVAVESGRSSS